MELSLTSSNWRDRANCKGFELKLFFEKYESSLDTASFVNEVCAECPVRRDCLKMGLATSGTGVHNGVYLSLGQLSKQKNMSRTAEELEEYRELITELRDELHDER